MTKDFEKLTARQKLFCDEYLKDRNGQQAALRAGYSKFNAKEQASRMLTKAHVKNYIDSLTKKVSEESKITATTILQELLRLARVDLAGAYDEKGNLLPVKEMPEDVRRAISSIDVFEEYEGYGKERVNIGKTKKIKFHDKTRSLELLGKHLKLFTDRIEHSGKLTLEEILEGAKNKE